MFDVMTCFKFHDFWRHDKSFDAMVCFCVTNFATSLRVFLYDKRYDTMMCFMKSWRVYGIMTIFWYDKLFDVMTYVAFIYVITKILTPWNFLTTSHTIWHPDTLLAFMTNPLTRFLSSGHNFSLFWEQNIMKTCLWCYTKLFDVIACFWCHDELFEVMVYFWHTFWHHKVVFFTLFLNISGIFDVMTNLLTS